jgi:hypothetical protein
MKVRTTDPGKNEIKEVLKAQAARKSGLRLHY